MAEDNLADALLVREAITSEKLPLQLHIVSDGEKAIDFIHRADTDPTAPCPHLMLLDLNLPRRDGFEVLRELRGSDRCKATPVLVMTSSDSPTDISQAAALGARYFRKPADYDQFLALGSAIKDLLTEHGML